MTFYVEDESKREWPFSVRNLLEAVAIQTLAEEKCPYEVQVNLLVTDNEGIREFNRQYRGLDRETDVLSFPNLDFEIPGDFGAAQIPEKEADYFDPDSKELILGDIILSGEKVLAQAEEYGHSVRREFAFLIAHSILHLCGYDHMEEEEAKTMEKLQESVLGALGITREKPDEPDGCETKTICDRQ